MKSKQNIKTTLLLVAAVAALFVIMLANQAVSEEYMTTIKGQIASVNGYDRTLSVMGKEGQYTFSIDRSTNVVICDMNKSFEDLDTGQNVTVTYHAKDGKFVADSVEIAPVILACSNEY